MLFKPPHSPRRSPKAVRIARARLRKALTWLRARPAWLRGWQLWTVPPGLQYYLLAICAGWLVAGAIGLNQTPFRLSDGLIFILLIAGGAIAVEASRRQGEPAGELVRDLLSAWFLPIVFVLPPVYSLLAPVPLLVLTQYRVRQSLWYRRSLTVAVIGLADALASVIFHAARASWDPSALRPGGVALIWAVLAVVSALIATVVNLGLMAIAFKYVSPETTWRELMWDRSHLVIDSGEICIGVILGLLCVLHPLLALIALIPVVLLQRAMLHDQLWAAARLDPKTGLLNAPTWEREAASEISRAQRTKTALSVMLLDLDHFKAVNDQYGHLAGDDVLTAVADVMRGQLREYDRCARFGGDEFAVLLPQSDLKEATQTAERIRRHVAAITVPAGNAIVRTSVSIGIAQLWSPQQGVTDLLAEADLSLYRAKESRDQVHSAYRDDAPTRRHT